MAKVENAMSRQMKVFNNLPVFMQRYARSKVFGSYIKFAGTAGVDFEEVTQERVICNIANVRKVQNHIKGVHAAAMALVAETASGFAFGMNLPDDKLPLIKSMKIEYLKRAQGSLRAVASLTPEQVVRVQSEEKGDVLVSVIVTDESGIEPIRCEMIWAWVPKKRKEVQG
ncbi:DUF4442 domain-containing protein [Burkholderiaceae bacterium DAT-1]|nr:DUF4442 domain-containing protein [Burkholderiaceae bacterium DAT-1]